MKKDRLTLIMEAQLIILQQLRLGQNRKSNIDYIRVLNIQSLHTEAYLTEAIEEDNKEREISNDNT
jgi:hypothetical protein